MIVVHVFASILALALGLLILALPKGTRTHRTIGAGYTMTMLTLAGTSFFIYELSGSFTFFHLVSIQTIVLVSIGIALPLLLRRVVAEWHIWHLRMMLYSYLTLVMTGVSTYFDLLPFASNALNAIVFLQLPAILSFYLIERRGVRHWRRKFAHLRSTAA